MHTPFLPPWNIRLYTFHLHWKKQPYYHDWWTLWHLWVGGGFPSILNSFSNSLNFHKYIESIWRHLHQISTLAFHQSLHSRYGEFQRWKTGLRMFGQLPPPFQPPVTLGTRKWPPFFQRVHFGEGSVQKHRPDLHIRCGNLMTTIRNQSPNKFEGCWKEREKWRSWCLVARKRPDTDCPGDKGNRPLSLPLSLVMCPLLFPCVGKRRGGVERENILPSKRMLSY